MNVLVLNSGSSSLKFQLIETSPGGSQQKLGWGAIDRIGADAFCRFQLREEIEDKALAVPDHDQAARLLIGWLGSRLGSSGIDAVGHRVVHGGERFTSPVVIDDAVISALDALSELAPLHNPAALSGIRAAKKILGESLPMVAVFDTSFHHTIPPHAANYAIPYEFAQKHRIRRYGFHGIAHRYDAERYAKLQRKPYAEVNIVALHLGNGCSAAAIRRGQSIDTSMGFTPLEGLVMGTRSGDLDPALVSYIALQEHIDAGEVENWLNKRAGLLGLSGRSNDMRELIALYDKDQRSRLAVEVFCYRARKYVAGYLAALEGSGEALVFSGGIGENAPLVRAEICRGLQWCGIKLDPAANDQVIGGDGRISANDSKLLVWVIHTDEEAIIAADVVTVLEKPAATKPL
jgi:acetate kinase